MMTLLLVILALAGAPLFAVIAASAMLGFTSEEVDLSVMGIEIYRLAEMPVLLAIPLFTFAGYLLGESDAPKRLVRLTNALLGWLANCGGGMPPLVVISIPASPRPPQAGVMKLLAWSGSENPRMRQSAISPRGKPPQLQVKSPRSPVSMLTITIRLPE